jgi:hypothetical protein
MPINAAVIVGALMIVAGISVIMGMIIGGRLGRAAVRDHRQAGAADAADRCTTTLEQPAVQIPDGPVRTHSRTWDETVTIGIAEHLRQKLLRK